MRRAVDEAYRELPQQAWWSYYRRRAVINTVAPQDDGTIAYTHSSRTVTLTGSTFPTNAEKYRIIIGDTHYDIESYTDSTNIVLPTLSNPGANVASGTAYTLYRNEYPLPVGFRRALTLVDVDALRPVRMIVDSEEHTLQMGGYGVPGRPNFACIRNTGETTGGLSLVFNCPPDEALAFDLLYDTFPRQFVIPEKYSTGTVTISSGSASLTGTGTTFPTGCAGCVIRLSSTSGDEPTGPFGGKVDKIDLDNPYAFQSVIKTRGSATSLTLVDEADAAYSGVKYTISDPLDIEDGAMFTALMKMAIANYARISNRDLKTVQYHEQMAREAIIVAKENDRRVTAQRGSVYVDYRNIQNGNNG